MDVTRSSTHGIKGEHVEKVIATVVILNGISSKSEWNQSTAEHERRKMHVDKNE